MAMNGNAAPPPSAGKPLPQTAGKGGQRPAPATSGSSFRGRRSAAGGRRPPRGRARKRKTSGAGGPRLKKKIKVEYDRSDYSKPLPVDLSVYCLLDGMYREATVLEVVKRAECPVALPSEEEELGEPPVKMEIVNEEKQELQPSVEERIRGHKYVYYVHFAFYDRRMDDYVTRNRIRFKDEIPPEKIAITPRPLEPDPVENVKVGAGGGYRGGARQSGDSAGHGESATKIRNIAYITLGKHHMKTWYHSPLPVEYRGTNNLLFCEFCLNFFKHQEELDFHMLSCDVYHPPGNEIYRSEERNVTICMFEVDGTKEKEWSENLCYISKLFLEHKTLNEDTSIFLFYVLCEVDAEGCHIVGYFSKEKIWTMNNLACILTLPCHQRKGYGKFLISFSYALSRIEQRTGSPERPLSDLGRRSYLAYWTEILAQQLVSMEEEHRQQKPVLKQEPEVTEVQSSEEDVVKTTMKELSMRTSISIVDVQDCLRSSSMLVCKSNQWCLDRDRIRELHQQRLEKAQRRLERLEADPNSVSVDMVRPELIRWIPFFARRRTES